MVGEGPRSDPPSVRIGWGRGTTVPVKTLVQYRDGHSPLYEFLLDFPEVRPVQAKQFLDWWLHQEQGGARDVDACLLALRDQALRLQPPTG